jgi:hypothetical protein
MSMEWLQAAHHRFLKEQFLIRILFWMGLLVVWEIVVATVDANLRLGGTPWWAYVGVAVVLCAYVGLDALPTHSAKRRDRK